jgi:phosphate transport system substrate-binding protein
MMVDWNLQQTDSEASYIPSGSGIGIELFELSEIEFAGSDIVLNESVYEDYPTFQLLPSVVGAIAISYNVPLLRNKLLPLVLDAETTAQIFAGEIRRWNDPRLIARNPDLNSSILDDIDIILLLRDGSSGTTQQFTSYLNSAAPETWKYGSPSTFPVTMLSEKGVKFSLVSSQDMLAQTISVDYSISYQSYANLLSVGPFVAHMINRAGNQVSPSVASVLAAEQSATFTPYLTASLVNLDAKEAWPISMYSYFLIDRGDCQTTHSLLSMFNWFYTAEEVQVYLEVSGFSLANRTKERVLSIIRGVTCNGRLVLKETLFDGREDFIMLFLFGSVYVIFSILSILAVYQHVTKHSKEPLFSKVTSIICAFLLNVSPVPYFFSPTDLVCTSRVLLLISWIVLVAFFSSRASLLYTLDQYDKANNLSGIVSICEEAKHCHNQRSLVAYCWVALNICYLVTWVMFFNVRAESILADPVAYSANIFCTSDYFTELLLLQLSLISVLSLNVV